MSDIELVAVPRVGLGEPAADVVFVHGLSGNLFTTWTREDSKNGSWIEWLAAEHRDLQFHRVGYPSAKSLWNEKRASLSLPDLAVAIDDFIESRGIGRRRVAFVCHSMGGVILKLALRKSAERRSGLLGATSGIIFLATPHTGSAMASVASWVPALRATDAVQQLRRNDGYLRDLASSFTSLAVEHRLKVRAYREGRPTAGDLMVVDPDSSDPRVPGCACVATDADHFDIARPLSKSDPVYSGVSSFLRDVFQQGLAHRNQSVTVESAVDHEATEGGGNVATVTDQLGIQLRIDRNIDEYSAEDQEKLMRTIATFLGLDTGVTIHKKERGSVLLTLGLPPELAERLLWAVRSGKFREFGVTAAELVELKGQISAAAPPDPLAEMKLQYKQYSVEGASKIRFRQGGSLGTAVRLAQTWPVRWPAGGSRLPRLKVQDLLQIQRAGSSMCRVLGFARNGVAVAGDGWLGFAPYDHFAPDLIVRLHTDSAEEVAVRFDHMGLDEPWGIAFGRVTEARVADGPIGRGFQELVSQLNRERGSKLQEGTFVVYHGQGVVLDRPEMST